MPRLWGQTPGFDGPLDVNFSSSLCEVAALRLIAGGNCIAHEAFLMAGYRHEIWTDALKVPRGAVKTHNAV